MASSFDTLWFSSPMVIGTGSASCFSRNSSALGLRLEYRRFRLPVSPSFQRFFLGERLTADVLCLAPGHPLPAINRRIDVERVDFDAVTAATGSLGGQDCGAAPKKWIEDDLVWSCG